MNKGKIEDEIQLIVLKRKKIENLKKDIVENIRYVDTDTLAKLAKDHIIRIVSSQ